MAPPLEAEDAAVQGAAARVAPKLWVSAASLDARFQEKHNFKKNEGLILYFGKC